MICRPLSSCCGPLAGWCEVFCSRLKWTTANAWARVQPARFTPPAAAVTQWAHKKNSDRRTDGQVEVYSRGFYATHFRADGRTNLAVSFGAARGARVIFRLPDNWTVLFDSSWSGTAERSRLSVYGSLGRFECHCAAQRRTVIESVCLLVLK